MRRRAPQKENDVADEIVSLVRWTDTGGDDDQDEDDEDEEEEEEEEEDEQLKKDDDEDDEDYEEEPIWTASCLVECRTGFGGSR